MTCFPQWGRPEAGILCNKLSASRPWGSSPHCTIDFRVTLAKSLPLSGLQFPHV